MALDDYGIISIDTPLTMKFTKRKKVEPGSPVFTSAGLFSTATAKKLHWLFSAEGKGDLPADFLVGASGPAITGLSGGKSLIDSSEESQTNDGEPNEWDASGIHIESAGIPA